METAWKSISGIASGVFVLAFLGYFGWRALERSEDPARLVFKWFLTVIFVAGLLLGMRLLIPPLWPILAVLVGLPIAITWAPNIGAWVASPLTGLFDGGDQEVEAKPLYSMAESKRQNNFYDEAIAEIHKQLEKFPDDFTGTMLLAAIQTEDLKDLAAGTFTVEKLLATGQVPPHSTAAALQTLADWQLKYTQDTAAASALLQRIVDAYPDTQLAQQAEQRIARMDSVDSLLKDQAKRKFEVTPGIRNIGLRNDVKKEEAEINPAVLANQYVKQLERHPMDTDTREKLALLYAEKFQRLELAVDQLEQLIAHPSESVAHIGRWMNLLATLYVKHGGDIVGAEQVLHRLIERFPKSAIAHAAQTRLAYLDQELKALDKTESKALGTYEQKMGLKKAGWQAAAE